MPDVRDELVDDTLISVHQLNALPLTAVIETRQRYVLERLSDGWWRPGLDRPYTEVFDTWLPAKLLRYHELRSTNERQEEQP